MLSRISKKLKRSKLRKTKDEETEKEVEVLPGFRNLFSEEVPRFPEALIKYLEDNGGANVEGIFRIPGSQQDMQTMHKLYLSAGDEIVFDFTGYSIHTIAGALKLWVRKMPVPLLTFELYETWMNATEIAEEDLKLSAIIKVTNSLPPAHKSFLKRILQFLVKIAENSEETKMSSVNLAIVFSPTFLRGLDESNVMKLLNDQIKGNGLIQILIDKYNEIFGLKRRNAPKLRRDKTIEEKNFIKSLQKGSVVLAKALIIEHHRSRELQYEDKENNENETKEGTNEEIKKDSAEEEQIKKEAAGNALLLSIPKIDSSNNNNNNNDEEEPKEGWTTSRKRNCLTRSMPIAPHRKELKDQSHRQLLKKLSQSNFSDLLEIKNDLPPSLSSQITKLSSSRLLDYFDTPPKPSPPLPPKPSPPSPLSSSAISVDNLSLLIEEYSNNNTNDNNNDNNNDNIDKEEANHEHDNDTNNNNDNNDNNNDNDNNEIENEVKEENKEEVPTRKIMQLNVTNDSENEELIEELSLNEHENIVLGIITGHIGAVGEFLQTINDEEANSYVANLESKYASYFADFDEFSQSVIESDSPRSHQIDDLLAD